MKLLALPRDPNPYQRLLYGALAAQGVRVRYAGELTPSHTLNLLLLPLELAVARLCGWRALHIHWVFGFALPGSRRHALLRRLSELWFRVVLSAARLLGTRLVWTAHNVLPHEPVFADDRATRRALVGACDLVIAHSQAALDGLGALGATPRCAAVVPLASPDAGTGPDGRSPGADGPLRALFFGKVLEYKGVEDLLAAAAELPEGTPLEITVVGEAPDPRLGERLGTLAAGARVPVRLALRRVTDEELARLLADADVVVLPFRRVTTSTSLLHAMAHARGVVLPDLPALRDLPEGAVVRYDGSVDGLARTLGCLSGPDRGRVAELGRAAREYTRGLSWELVAERTLAALRGCGLDGAG